MPTLLNMVERLRLARGEKPHRDTLNGSITSSATSITLTSGLEIADDGIIEIDLELLAVTDKPTATTATVVRGVKGTTAATHANAAEVLSGFQFSKEQYRQAINHSLQAISVMFGKLTWDETASFSRGNVVNVPAAAIRVLAVQQSPSSGYFRGVPFTFLPSVPASIASTGKAIRLEGYNPGSGTAYIQYDAPWAELVALTDSTDTQFPSDAIDLIQLGAEAWLYDNEAFKRIAFSFPHLRETDTSGELRLATNQALARFLQRRTEVAARFALRRPMTWIKG